MWPSPPHASCIVKFAPTGPRLHTQTASPKLIVHRPGVSQHPANPLWAFMPAWHSWFECNKELLSASESSALAVWSAAAFPGTKSVCNAWSDTHWQPAQTFPARLHRLQSQRGDSCYPPLCLTWHFLIKALNLEGRRRTSRGKQTGLCPVLKPLCCCLHLSLRCVSLTLSLSVGVWRVASVLKRCSEPSSWGLRGLSGVDLLVDSFCPASICVGHIVIDGAHWVKAYSPDAADACLCVWVRKRKGIAYM